MTVRRSHRNLGLCLIIFGLAALANYLFTGECLTRFGDAWIFPWGLTQRIASGCIAAGVLVSFWLFCPRHDFRTLENTRFHPKPASSSAGLTPFVPFLCLWAASSAIYLLRGENSAVRWTWLLSTLALAAPLLRSMKWRDFWPLPFSEYLLLVMVVGAAFVVRYNDLTDIPYHVDNDVSIMGLYSKAMIANNDWSWIGMAPTQHQYSEHQYIAICMRLFGANHYGVSMCGVLAGTATVAVLYFIAKIACNRWVALLAATFLAFNYVHIHFSRILFGPLSTLFLAVALLFLLHGLRNATKLSFALGGLSLGAGLLSYYSARVGPVVVVIGLLLWMTRRKDYPGVTWAHWAIGVTGVLAAFGPNLAFALTHLESFSGRGNEVVLWTQPAWTHLSEKYASGGSAAIVWIEQIKRTLLAPFYYADESTICYLRKPMLGAFSAICFVFGLGYCLRRIRRAEYALPLGWAGLTFVFGGILTIDPPFWPHLNIAVPALTLIAAIGAERLIRCLILGTGRRGATWIPIAFSALVIGFCIHNWEVYSRFSSVFSTARTLGVRMIARLPTDYRVYVISDNMDWSQEAFQFMAAGVDGQNLPKLKTTGDIPRITHPTAFVVFFDDGRASLEVLASAFPLAQRKTYFDGWDSPAFTIVTVFPPGYTEFPQRSRNPVGSVWSLRGWQLLSAGALAVLALGWTLLARDEWFKRLHARLDLSHLRRPAPSGNSAPPLPPELPDRWVKLQHRSKRAASATRPGFRISE